MGTINDIRKTLTLLRKIVKYGVFGLAAICIIYYGLMYFDYDIFGIHLLIFSFALVLRLTLSKIFNFCWVHKLCVIYIFLVSLCVATLRHNIIEIMGMNIKQIQLIMFLFGISLVPLVLIKLKDKSC